MTVAPVELASTEELMALVDDAINDGSFVSMHDDEGVYTWASWKVIELLGYRPDELVGLNAWAFIHPEDEVDTRESKAATLAGKTTRTVYRIRHKDGSWRPVSSTAWTAPGYGIVVITKLEDAGGASPPI